MHTELHTTRGGNVPNKTSAFLLFQKSKENIFLPSAPLEFSPSPAANFMYGHTRPSGVVRSRLRSSGSKQYLSSSLSQSHRPGE